MAQVLVVDDDEGIRESIRFALEDDGYEVFEAAGAEPALALLRTLSDPLVVMLDLVMQGGDGTVVLRAARDEPGLDNHCYILLTAMPLSHYALPEDLYSLLIFPVIAKPFELDALLASVEEAVKRVPCGS